MPYVCWPMYDLSVRGVSRCCSPLAWTRRLITIVFCFGFLMILYWLLSICRPNFLTTSKEPSTSSDMESASTKKISSLPIIVPWTSNFHWTKKTVADFYNEKQAECPYRCTITSNRRYAEEADALLFLIRSWNPRDLKLPPRHPDQYFVFVMNESPPHTFLNLNIVPRGFFNITMTYRQSSEIRYVYDRFEKIDETTPRNATYSWDEVKDAVSKKTKSVLQLTSYCTTVGKREIYIEELKNYINISQYGNCSKTPCDRKCEESKAKFYHFIIAFENSVCRDYITEKFFRTKKYLTVPIVLKDSICKDIVPPHSYIAADQFESPQKLAEYLIYLEKNHDEYIKYFEWTRIYKNTKRAPVICDLCKFLHQKPKKKMVIEDIKKWWIDDEHCHDGFGEVLVNRTRSNLAPSTPIAEKAESSSRDFRELKSIYSRLL